MLITVSRMANRSAAVSVSPNDERSVDRGGWTFLTNHAHVLLVIARDQQVTLREAARVGITERAAQAIVADLVTAGYLTRTRRGRRNVYTIPAHRPLRHPLDARHCVDELLDLLVPEGSGTA